MDEIEEKKIISEYELNNIHTEFHGTGFRYQRAKGRLEGLAAGKKKERNRIMKYLEHCHWGGQ